MKMAAFKAVCPLELGDTVAIKPACMSWTGLENICR